MAFDLRTVPLRKLSALTRYPSIPTYHAFDPRGAEVGAYDVRAFVSARVVATEKLDGVHARVIFLPDGSHLIGSREELLYASGDLLANPALGIAEALRPLADRIDGVVERDGAVVTVYGELFGGKINAASRRYTRTGVTGFRVFDVSTIEKWETALALPMDALERWRDGEIEDDGDVEWAHEERLIALAETWSVPLVPRVWQGHGYDVPTGVESVRGFLRSVLDRTVCALDDVDSGRCEGIVLRLYDRAQIAKLRHEDYDRAVAVRR